jgi:hypothetical protein
MTSQAFVDFENPLLNRSGNGVKNWRDIFRGVKHIGPLSGLCTIEELQEHRTAPRRFRSWPSWWGLADDSAQPTHDPCQRTSNSTAWSHRLTSKSIQTRYRVGRVRCVEASSTEEVKVHTDVPDPDCGLTGGDRASLPSELFVNNGRQSITDQLRGRRSRGRSAAYETTTGRDGAFVTGGQGGAQWRRRV